MVMCIMLMMPPVNSHIKNVDLNVTELKFLFSQFHIYVFFNEET